MTVRKTMRLRSRVARLNNRLGHWGPLIGGFLALALVFVFGLVSREHD